MAKEKNFTFDNSLYNMFDELITYTNSNNEIIDCNKAFLEFINKSKKEVLKRNEFTLLKINLSSTKQKKVENKKMLSYEETSLFSKEEQAFFSTKKRRILDKNSKTTSYLTIRKNITKAKINYTIYKEYKKLLKHIAKGKSLTTILNKLVKSVEKKNQHMMCSVLLLDKSGTRLFSAAAPSLPERYMSKLEGMEIGEKVGSCGAAVFCKKRIVVENISTHENWKLAKNLASRNNLHACWSQPIISSKGEVLGTFAMYYDEPKKPTNFDSILIEDAASIAGIAIEKHKNEYQLNKNYENEQKQDRLLMHKSKQAMMGEMLENIAHQWRQPLSAITTCASGVQLKRELSSSTLEEEDEALENINLNAKYLSQTIEDFRSYFKSDNKIVKFNLKEAFDHTLKLVNARLQNDDVQIIENIKNITIMSLENELTQVFMNLLNNSIDELKNYPKDARFVSIKIYQDGNDAIIKVIDSAGGAKNDIINRIFEPYFTTKHKAQGTGIGLYMCKEIMEKHVNGTIEARNNIFEHESVKYEGLEFIITIPIS